MATFKVRDFRNKGFFLLDDVYLNGYAKLLGTTSSMVYIYLCRCADKNQSSFPSQEIIAEKLGINERVVMRKIKELVEWNLISSVKTRGDKGTWRHNTYHLLDKSEWKQPPTQKVHLDSPPTQKVPKPPTQIMYIKDTHVKDTHNINTNVLIQGNPVVYGNADINKIIEHLKEKFNLSVMDGTTVENRQYANLCLKKFKSLEIVLKIIDAASVNPFWENKISSVKKIYYNAVSIMAEAKKGTNAKRRISFIDPA